MKEFFLKYENGLRCRYVVREKPLPGAEHRPEITWEGGTPTHEEFPKYKDWINSVTQQLANEWGRRLVHVFVMRPNVREAWGYEPGSQPVQITSPD